MTPRIIETPDAQKLRAYATRLMAFALKAVTDGDTDFAARLTARAAECLDHAQVTEGILLGLPRDGGHFEIRAFFYEARPKKITK
jgi:hypothetical protein